MRFHPLPKIPSLAEHLFLYQKIVLFLMNRHLATVIHSLTISRTHSCILWLQTKEWKHQGLQPIGLTFKDVTDSKYPSKKKKKAMAKKHNSMELILLLPTMQLSQENAHRTFYTTKNDHMYQVECICSFNSSYNMSFEDCFQLCGFNFSV